MPLRDLEAPVTLSVREVVALLRWNILSGILGILCGTALAISINPQWSEADRHGAAVACVAVFAACGLVCHLAIQRILAFTKAKPTNVN